MSSQFPSMISNEPPPLDSEDDDSESFKDFASSGLKLDILGDSTPQQSPIKTPAKKSLVSNGFNFDNEPKTSPAAAHQNASLANGCVQDVDQNFEISNTICSPQEEIVFECALSINNENADTDTQDESFGEILDCKISEDQNSDCPSPPVNEVSVQEETFFNAQDEIFVDDNDAADQNKGGESIGVQNSTIQTSALSDEVVECRNALEDFSSEIVLNVDEYEINQSECEKDNHVEALDTASPQTLLDTCSETFTAPVGQIQMREEIGYCDFQTVSMPFPSLEEQCPVDKKNDNFLPTTPQQIVATVETDLDEFGDFENAFSTFSGFEPLVKAEIATDTTAQTTLCQADDDFGDFEAFQTNAEATICTSNENVAQNNSNNSMKTSYIGTIENIDDFGNFEEANTSSFAQEFSKHSQLQSQIQNRTDSLRDVVQFQSPSFPSVQLQETQKSASQKTLNEVESKLELLVKTIFLCDQQAPVLEDVSITPIDKEMNSDISNEEWRHVQDFEGAAAKWSNFTVHQRMLNSLKIDTTAVMYTGKWGTIEVPRFAASIVESPLQPKVYYNSLGSELSSTTPTTTSNQLVQEVTSSQENVASNKNQQKSGGMNRGPGGTEAQQILGQLPDLSFMRAKTLVFTTQIQD